MPRVTQEISTQPGSYDLVMFVPQALSPPNSMWPGSDTKHKNHADYGIPKHSRCYIYDNIYHTQERLRNILKYLYTLSVLLPWGAVCLQTEMDRC